MGAVRVLGGAGGDQLTVHLDLRKCFTFLPRSSSSYRLRSHCGFTPSQAKFTSPSPNVPLYPCVGRSGEEEENQMRKLIVETPRGRPQILPEASSSCTEASGILSLIVCCWQAIGEAQDPSCDADATIHARSTLIAAGGGAYFPSSDSGPCLTASRAPSVVGAHRRLSQSGCCHRRDAKTRGPKPSERPPPHSGSCHWASLKGS